MGQSNFTCIEARQSEECNTLLDGSRVRKASFVHCLQHINAHTSSYIVPGIIKYPRQMPSHKNFIMPAPTGWEH